MKRSELQNLIKKLGGPTVVASRLSNSMKQITPQAVSKWVRIPIHHCVAVESMARERQIVRSDGTPYTREIFQPEMEWGRGAPLQFTRVEA